MYLSISRCQKRTTIATELVDQAQVAWKQDHKEAMLVCDADDAIDECMALVPLLKETWSKVQDMLFAGQLNNFLAVRSDLIRNAGVVVKVLGRAKRLAQEVAEWKFATKVAQAEIQRQIGQAKSILKEIETMWPGYDAKMAAQSHLEYKRGNWTSAEDLIGDLGADS